MLETHAWDDAALGWSQHSALIRQWLYAATKAMLDAARIGPGQRVLDVAAGAGDQTLDIARRVGASGYVLATDASAAILTLAAENLQAAGFSWVKTQQADAQQLGQQGAAFDAVVCRLGLMFCPKPALALDGIFEALAVGGRFSGIVFSRPEANPCITTLMRSALRHAGGAAQDPYAAGSLLSLGQPGLLMQLLQDAGFAEIEVHALHAPFHTSCCQEYVEFVKSAGSPIIELLKPLPEPARAAAWADMACQLEAFSTPSGWSGPNELLLWSATRPQ
jgi:ubiquinone/menaquinone biosynthesis C-methylase UbiE